MKIKTILTGLAAIVAFGLASSRAQAQEVFDKGTQTAQLTVGLFGVYTNLKVPPVQLSYEYCVLDNLAGGKGSIGVGAMGAYLATGGEALGTSYYNHSGLIGGIASFHYQFIPKLDTYAGLFLGALISGGSTTIKGEGVTTTQKVSQTAAGFGWGVHLGARYYLTPNFALTGEVGYGYSVLNLGVTFRF